MSYLSSHTAGSVCGGGPQTIGRTFSNISDSHYIIECVSLPFKNKGDACVCVCVCVYVCKRASNQMVFNRLSTILLVILSLLNTHTHGQITLVHRSTYKERGVDVIARTAYMLKHGTE